MRQLKQAGKTMDPEAYREAMRQLEDALKKLKSMCDNEIDKLRYETVLFTDGIL